MHMARQAAQSRLAGPGAPALQIGAGGGTGAAGPRVTLKLRPEAAHAHEPHPLARCLAAVERALAHPDAGPFAQPVRSPVHAMTMDAHSSFPVHCIRESRRRQ